MINKKIEQPFRDAVSFNMEVMVDRAMLCPNALAKKATPYNYRVFHQVGYINHDAVHTGIYEPLRELFRFHLWPVISKSIFNCLHEPRTTRKYT